MLVGHMGSGFQVMLDDLYVTWNFAMCLWWFECVKIYYAVLKPVKLILLVVSAMCIEFQAIATNPWILERVAPRGKWWPPGDLQHIFALRRLGCAKQQCKDMELLWCTSHGLLW